MWMFGNHVWIVCRGHGNDFHVPNSNSLFFGFQKKFGWFSLRPRSQLLGCQKDCWYLHTPRVIVRPSFSIAKRAYALLVSLRTIPFKIGGSVFEIWFTPPLSLPTFVSSNKLETPKRTNRVFFEFPYRMCFRSIWCWSD
mmetsp:Transcript_39193/g.47138  ORF Transcript_39193/g.47138 Transcript_39193/m.47138 type:complete len:139 (+) Transcript_39193:44-460(+)